MCDECFPQAPQPLTFAEFTTELCAFRECWSTERFWRESSQQREQHIDRLLTAFGIMDGTAEQISSAGMGLRASIIEYRLRNGLRLQR